MEYLIHRGEMIPLIGFGTYRLENNEYQRQNLP